MLLALALLASAQDGPETVVTPHLEVRPRAAGLYTEGLATGIHRSRSALAPLAFERSRLGLEVERGPIRGSVGLQSGIQWAYRPDRDAYRLRPPSLDIYEAIVGVRLELPSRIDIDMDFGRKRWVLHNGRLVSDNDFLVDATILDGFRGVLETEGARIGVMQYRDFGRDLELLDSLAAGAIYGGLHGESVRGNWMVEAILLGDDPLDLFVYGLIAERALGRFNGGFEVYGAEVGIDPDALDRRAMLASAWVGVTLGPERLVELELRYDGVTGDGTTEGLLFPAPAAEVHEVFGHMDLFQTTADVDGRGIHDAIGSLTLHPRRRFEVALDGHVFATQQQTQLIGGEVDALGTWNVAPILDVSLAGQVFIGTGAWSDLTSLNRLQLGGYGQLDLTL